MKNKKNSNPTYELEDFEYKVGNIKRKIAVSITSSIVTNEDLEMATRDLENFCKYLDKKNKG